MARVPTWTELRLDATKLIQMQRDCNRSVHNLLDFAIPELDRKLSILSGYDLKKPALKLEPPPQAQAPSLPASPSPPPPPPPAPPAPPKVYSKSDLEDLEHLRAPPLTPSEYLRLNRPEMIINADRRVMYLKKSADRRKYISAAKAINALEHLKLAPRNTTIKRSADRSSPRSTISRESGAPSYQVKCKMSEKEMKRLTARVYNKLPEVKKQLTEEVSKHMKVQYYKNKLEYGRKLLANRKNGVINYPLRPNYEDSSINGSQDSSITSSGDRSSDTFRFESY